MEENPYKSPASFNHPRRLTKHGVVMIVLWTAGLVSLSFTIWFIITALRLIFFFLKT